MVRFLSLSNAEYKKTIAHITNILYPPLLPTRRHYGASNQTKRSVGRASLHHFSKHFTTQPDRYPRATIPRQKLRKNRLGHSLPAGCVYFWCYSGKLLPCVRRRQKNIAKRCQNDMSPTASQRMIGYVSHEWYIDGSDVQTLTCIHAISCAFLTDNKVVAGRMMIPYPLPLHAHSHRTIDCYLAPTFHRARTTF